MTRIRLSFVNNLRPCRLAGLGVLSVVLAGTTGCDLSDSVVDGFYGGISDTMATIVSNLLLGLGN